MQKRLNGRRVPRSPEQLALTADLVALTIRPIADPGPPAGFTYFEEADYPALVAQAIAGAPAGPVWLFAFGSLIWKPGCDYVEERKGLARGWHRAFRLGWDYRWRGNAEHPNLMMGLDRGGECHGILYRLPPGEEEKNLDALIRREVRIKPPQGRPITQVARWLTIDSAGERIRAVAFVLNRRGPGYQGARSHTETAEVLSKSCGINGSGAEYLYKTVKQLAEHGIYDRNLWELQELVAQRIRERHAALLGVGGVPPPSS
jgi:cation transport protein ChaC